MKHNIILRPAYNRPEMLQLSINYEIAAKEAAAIQPQDYHTLFLIEYGAPQKVIDIAKSYPYPATIKYRNRWWRSKEKRRYGITRNLLEGMKEGFPDCDHHAIVIEDDILLHRSYFQYINTALSMSSLCNFSVLSATGFNQHGDNQTIYTDRNNYSPLAPLISKVFWEKYIKTYATSTYYQNRKKTIHKLNLRNKQFWNNGYKFNDNPMYNNHDGLINRLVDVARLEHNLFMITPEVSRQIHIGIYGMNNKAKPIKGRTFDERLVKLQQIIDKNKLEEFVESSILSFDGFSPSLENWNGTLKVRNDPAKEQMSAT